MGQVNLAQHILQDIAKWAKYHLAQKITLKSGPSKVLGPFLHVTSSNAKLVSCVFSQLQVELDLQNVCVSVCPGANFAHQIISIVRVPSYCFYSTRPVFVL